MSRDTSLLTPRCRAKCEALIAACARVGIVIIVVYTLRTAAEQAALWAQGRLPLDAVNKLRKLAGMAPVTEEANRYTVTQVKVSRHQANKDGLSEAFDIAIRDPHQGITWNPKEDANQNGHPDWPEIGHIAEGLGLTWGGRFPKVDAGHYQDDEEAA